MCLYSAVWVNNLECFSYHPLLSPPSVAPPIFPPLLRPPSSLSSGTFNYLSQRPLLLSSTSLSLPSFILISLFRQIGSAKWGNYENCALMNCKISSLARPPASHLNLSKGEGGRRCIEVDQRMVLRVRDSPSPDSPWQQVAFMQPRNHCLAEQCTSTQHIFLQVRNQSFT